MTSTQRHARRSCSRACGRRSASRSRSRVSTDTLTSVCCPAFDYDIMLWGWGSDPDPAFLLGVALCAEIPTGFSETGYCNEEYDALYDAQAIEQDRPPGWT